MSRRTRDAEAGAVAAPGAAAQAGAGANGSSKAPTADMLYLIDERPHLLLTIFLGFQHYLIMFGATVTIPRLLATALGPGATPISTADTGVLINTIFFMSGWSTLIQVLFGNRLPLIQGGTFSFLGPAFSVMHLPSLKPLPWQAKINAIQGAVIVGAIVEMVLAATGLIGIIAMFISPISLAVTVTLVGLGLFRAGAGQASDNWWLAALVLVSLVFFSQILRRLPGCKNSTAVRYISMFSVVISVVLAWVVGGIFSAAGVIQPPAGSAGAMPPPMSGNDTDATPAAAPSSSSSSPVPPPPPFADYRIGGYTSFAAVADAPWVRWPAPFQFGTPTFVPEAILVFFAGYLASIAESIGDYYAAARFSGAKTPTSETINRGILAEGFGCLLDGIVGTGNGTTSYSENISALSITRVGSRGVVIAAACWLIVLGLIAKVGALFASIPDSIIGGLWLGLFGLIAAVGLSNLQYVDLNSQRNLFVLGFGLFTGLSVPAWVKGLPAGHPLQVPVLSTIFSTEMAVGLIFSVLLDNVIPSDKVADERGLKKLGVDGWDWAYYRWLRALPATLVALPGELWRSASASARSGSWWRGWKRDPAEEEEEQRQERARELAQREAARGGGGGGSRAGGSGRRRGSHGSRGRHRGRQ